MTTKTEATPPTLNTPWTIRGDGETHADVVDALGRTILEGETHAVRAVVALANGTIDLDDKAGLLHWKTRAGEMERQANAAEDRATNAERDLKAARLELLAAGARKVDGAKAVAVVTDTEAVAELASGRTVTLPKEEGDAIEAARTPAAGAPLYRDAAGVVAFTGDGKGGVVEAAPMELAPGVTLPVVPVVPVVVRRPARASVSPADALEARRVVNMKAAAAGQPPATDTEG